MLLFTFSATERINYMRLEVFMCAEIDLVSQNYENLCNQDMNES